MTNFTHFAAAALIGLGAACFAPPAQAAAPMSPLAAVQQDAEPTVQLVYDHGYRGYGYYGHGYRHRGYGHGYYGYRHHRGYYGGYGHRYYRGYGRHYGHRGYGHHGYGHHRGYGY